MSNLYLEQLIDEFSTERITRFFRDKSTKFAPRKESLDEYNDTQFKESNKLGEIRFDETEGLIICAFLCTTSLSERSGKKAQYEKAKSILKERSSDAGIFVFYDKDGNFRFSLVYANYLGKKRDWSTFKRFTYFVSKQFTNKTFLKRIGDSDFNTLEKIKDAFSVEKVTKEFYQEISYWYFWAVQKCVFPKDAEAEENGRNIAVIRMITRMIFVWFMRERGLVPRDLFNRDVIYKILNDHAKESSTYYQAILQNLFFATLSTKKTERVFRSDIKGPKGYNPDFGNQYVYRFHELFIDPLKIQEYFADIPFLNGGLFDCFDDKKNDVYIDGFTETKKNQPIVPNYLFFNDETKVDINTELGTKNKPYHVRGLLEILSSFNFTIDENTPNDQDVALDPELLGRVFENLLASFNPETSSSARKATGSYYTPREIVDYMVDESIKGYLNTHLNDVDNREKKIDVLFSIGADENPFDNEQSKKIVRLIESIRVVDPAVGSGAFPMGVLNRLVFLLRKVDKENGFWKQAQLEAAESIPDSKIRQETKKRIELFFKEKNEYYGRKLFLIQKCIYGVDIQQIAVEIAKLRFFISLLVDEDIDKTKDNWGIEPLPNLDFKIMQGNSLISEFLGVKFEIEKKQTTGQIAIGFIDETSKLIRLFEQKKIDYQNESDKTIKIKLLNEIEDVMIKIFENIVKQQKANYFRSLNAIESKYSVLPNEKDRDEAITREKQKLNQQSDFDLDGAERQLREYTGKKKTRPFFPWQLYFAEVFTEKDGFDIVITNPPYIGEKGHKEIFHEVKQANLGKFYMGKMDFFYFFFHLALDLGNSRAHVAFITTNYYPTASGAVKLRKDFNKRTILSKLVNFNVLKIFESALGQHNMITVLQKGQRKDAIASTCITDQTGVTTPEILTKIVGGQDEKTQYFKVAQTDIYDGIEYLMRLTGTSIENNDPIQTTLNKVKINGIILGSICNVNQGIVTGADKVSKRHIEKYKLRAKVGEGIFVLNETEVKTLNLTIEEKEILKPWFKNSDINRWKTNQISTESLINADKRLRNLKGNKIKDYLNHFKEVIDNSSGNSPYLHRPREINFNGPKIVVPQRSTRNTFGYNEVPWYASADVYFITQNDQKYSLKYILALLNSSLYYLWLYHRGKRKGEALELYQQPLSEIPIKKLLEVEQKPFIEIVDRILTITKSDDYLRNTSKQIMVKDYEMQIDLLVYDLYGLTDEEIAVVKRSVNHDRKASLDEGEDTFDAGTE
jgi:adenine-specific DNA-methyltransferase